MTLTQLGRTPRGGTAAPMRGPRETQRRGATPGQLLWCPLPEETLAGGHARLSGRRVRQMRCWRFNNAVRLHGASTARLSRHILRLVRRSSE